MRWVVYVVFFSLLGFSAQDNLAANAPEISTNVIELVFSERRNFTTAPKTIVVTNTGDETLQIDSLTLSGTYASYFVLHNPPSSYPVNISAGDSFNVQVKFAPPSSGDLGSLSATLQVASNDPDEAVLSLGLYGLSTSGWSGSNEPTFQNVVTTLGYAIDVGWDDLANGTTATMQGEEVPVPLFRKANSGNVTITPVARYSPAQTIPFGYYTYEASVVTRYQVGVMAAGNGPHQTLLPPISAGGTTFDPGTTYFGIYVLGLDNRLTYSEDALNAGGPAIHAVRMYPLKNRQGVPVPNAYFVAFEDAANGDYQDYDYVLTNVQPSFNPYVTSPIDDQQAVFGQTDTIINLHNHFADDQDADSSLVFNVVGNTNSDVVSTSVVGGNLTLDFNTVGLTTITVQTQDIDGNIETASLSVTVDKANTTLTFTNPPETSFVNEPVTFTFSLSVNSPGAGIPTGNITISDGTLNCVASVAEGECTLTFPTLGERSVTATYAGDTNFNTSSASPIEHDVLNPAPTANNNAYNAGFETLLTINAPGVLGNDEDPNDDDLTAVLVETAAHGSLTLNTNGSFNYLPDDGFSGQDSFTYTANDDTSASNIATVTITVANGVPTSSNNTYNAGFETLLTINAPGVLGNDEDPNDDDLTAVLVETAAHGSLTLNANGSFNYLPDNGFSGQDSFTYTANDDTSASNITTVTITVANGAPTASNNTYNVGFETLLTINAPGVLGNDEDPNDDDLTAVLVETAAHGSLTLNSNGSFNYLPDDGFSGQDSFTYTANDDTSASNIATVTITVANGIPTATDDNYNAGFGIPLTIDAPGVLDNDVDPNGDNLTTILISSASHGNLTLNENGSFTYIPGNGFTGQDSFTYKATDGQAETVTANVIITVINGMPVVNDDHYYTDFEIVLVVNAPGVLNNDIELQGGILTTSLVSNVSHGSLTFNQNGAFIYTPEAGFSGDSSFSYQVHNGTQFSDVATVTITVQAAPTPTVPPPTATDPTPTGTDEPTATEPTPTGTDDPTPTEPTPTGTDEPTATEPTPTGTDDPTPTEPTPTGTDDPTPTEPTPTGTDDPTPTTQPPVNNPGDMTIVGDLTSGEIHPVFTWIPPVDDTNTPVLAEWYHIVIVQNEVIVFDQWLPASTLCINGVCSIQPNTDALPVGLVNGEYEWYLQSWTDAGGFSDYVGPVEFSVTVPMPAVPSPQMSVVDTSSGYPILNIPNDPGTSWYQIYIGTHDFAQTIDWQWYRKDPAQCNPSICTLYPNAHPLNGSYVLYIQTWGPAGFAENNPNLWTKLADFEMNFAAPQAVTGLSSSLNEQTLTLQWQASSGASWYNTWVGTSDFANTQYVAWTPALNLACSSGGICTMNFNVADLALLPGVNYIWYVQAWGPGGLSVGGDVEGWSQGTPIVIP